MKTLIPLENAVIYSTASVVGKMEHNGPLSDYFDLHDPSDMFGEKTFEKAESKMQRDALNLALSKVKEQESDLNAVFAGDLLNQCTASAYGLMPFGLQYFGLYGACSTAVEGIILSSILADRDVFRKSAVVASSHNSSAERQFRFPLEYGCQRPPTAQWTATASGAFLIGKRNYTNNYICSVSEALPGKIVDKGITDAGNMGAAMAPAAADTILRYFSQSKFTPPDFDLIATGDLGYEGHSICRELLKNSGLELSDNFTDCGILLYDKERQDTHSGGSGCGCSASVAAGYIMKKFQNCEFENVLLIGTGALMSPASIQQGESIGGIAHLVHFQKI